MNEDLTALAYLIAAICFISALRGLSSPETARQGNLIGITGMVSRGRASPHRVAYSYVFPAVLDLQSSYCSLLHSEFYSLS